jgi:hypothetical protein
MRAFSAAAQSLPTERKATLARHLTRVRERVMAARLVWSAGLAAPGFQIMAEAMRTACNAAREVVLDDTKTMSDVFVALGAPHPSRLSEIVDAQARISIPETNDDVVASHVAIFPRLMQASRDLLRALEPYAATEQDLARLRRKRMVTSLSIAGLGALFVALFIASQFRVRATCSAKYGASFEAPSVLDAHPDSEWLLPDQSPGWIDLHLSPSRSVSVVRIINAHNSTHNDRASKDVRIELYQRDRMIASIDGTFPAFTAVPDWVAFDVGRHEHVSRIRVVVKSWHGIGGGFGEIRFD